MAGARRVLLVQTSFLGDVVLTTPLARLLADALPSAEVWWLVRPDAVDLVAPLAGRDRVLAFAKRGADGGPLGLLRTARRLRGLGFDAAIGVQRSLRTAALLAAARIPLRVGFRGTLGAALYHRTVDRAGAHARDRLLGLARGLGIEPPPRPPVPRLVVDDGAATRVAARLEAAGIGAADRILVVAPGSAWATKRWPAASFAAAAAGLAADDAPAIDAVVAVGAPSDRRLASEIAAGLARAARAPRFLDLAGETTTGELVAALARASLVLANDSAPAHVAAALGRPVVALFGPTVPAQGFAPLGERVRVVERELACRPCSRHGGDRCPIGTHECLAGLDAGLVVSAARSLPGEPASAAASADPRRAGGAR